MLVQRSDYSRSKFVLSEAWTRTSCSVSRRTTLSANPGSYTYILSLSFNVHMQLAIAHFATTAMWRHFLTALTISISGSKLFLFFECPCLINIKPWLNLEIHLMLYYFIIIIFKYTFVFILYLFRIIFIWTFLYENHHSLNKINFFIYSNYYSIDNKISSSFIIYWLNTKLRDWEKTIRQGWMILIRF